MKADLLQQSGLLGALSFVKRLVQVSGSDVFLLRGMEKVDSEWHLIAASHNLLKLLRIRRSQQVLMGATG